MRMSDGEGRDWWESYFDETFVRLYAPLLGEERTLEEAAASLEILRLPPGAHLLDLACGWGRHAVQFALAGLEVTGLDRSATLLGRAREAAAREGAAVRWVEGDMRDPPLAPGFDAVVSLFSSLGYFAEPEDDLRVLRAARGLLKPCGGFLLETMHRDSVVREFAERDWWEGADGEIVWVEREFDAVEGVSHERLRWRAAAGTTEAEGERRHRIRIRTATEWDSLLRRAGLRPLEWFGDWDLSSFDHTSERLIVLAAPDHPARD
jgi:SAM-dependent methyltransferase